MTLSRDYGTRSWVTVKSGHRPVQARQALGSLPAEEQVVLLIDEVDKADIEFNDVVELDRGVLCLRDR